MLKVTGVMPGQLGRLPRCLALAKNRLMQIARLRAAARRVRPGLAHFPGKFVLACPQNTLLYASAQP
jgi:hypothetical protein